MKKNNVLSYTYSQLKRLIVPILVVTILLFINGPMALIFANKNLYRYISTFMYVSYFNKFIVYAALFLLPLIYCRVVFNYLFNEKIADFNLSLPISRKTQYLSGFITTAIATAIPIVLNLIITMVLYSTSAIPLPLQSNPDLRISYIFIEILMMIIGSLIVSAFCSFTAVFVGTKFEHFVYSSSLMILPIVVGALVVASAQMYIYGIRSYDFIKEFLMLSPVTVMASYAFIWDLIYNSSILFSIETKEIIMYIVISIIISAALLFIGMKISTKRKGEYSGRKGVNNIVATGLNIIFSYGIGFVVALFFFEIMNLGKFNSIFIFLTACFSALAYVIIHLIFTQNIKSIKNQIPFVLITVFISVVTFACYVTGGFGIEKRLPELNQIEHIELDYHGYAPMIRNHSTQKILGESITPNISDPEAIALVKDFHQKSLDEEPYDSTYVSIKYVLKNGKTIRRYFEPNPEEQLNIYSKLHDYTSFNESVFPVFHLETKDFTDVSVNDLKLQLTDKSISVSDQQKEQLLDALRADITNTINSSSIAEKGKLLGKINFSIDITSSKTGFENTETYSIAEYIRSDYTKTIALLKKLGYEFSSTDKTDITMIEFYYSDFDKNIIIDEVADPYHSVVISKDEITPELIDDIFKNAYPSPNVFSKLSNDFSTISLHYWKDDFDSYEELDLRQEDIKKIIEKYNLDGLNSPEDKSLDQKDIERITEKYDLDVPSN